MKTRPGLTVDKIAQAAAALADEVGFEGVTLSALARSFGVKDASLYSHVKNIQDVRTRVALLAAEEMSAELAVAVAGRSAEAALVAFADTYRAFALRHPGRYAATQMRLDLEEIADEKGFVRNIELTYAVLRAYDLEEPDLTDAVRFMRSTFHGFIYIESVGGFGHPRDIDNSWRRTVGAVHTALRQWPRTEPTRGAAGVP
ncbi:TetR/AcrR family transcriptional regulator [Streptomyces sp. NPDC057245]|uniref:TetR/AcrR family transcriptional regulator n=1 Tax=Streptomyces TaxID=1883 RepID=UPI001C1E5641|nr:TetR/AcrR family transcriptional regulator [Streptomyces sp. A108]MBU6533249.1 WHG domain-containing protein [Streptomyces sp. A108]